MLSATTPPHCCHLTKYQHTTWATMTAEGKQEDDETKNSAPVADDDGEEQNDNYDCLARLGGSGGDESHHCWGQAATARRQANRQTKLSK